MTAPTRNSRPTDDKPDPAAIDLDAIKARPAFAYQAAALIAAVEALREQVAEYDSLFDIAAQREQPWIEAWRKATGNHGTLPDYGRLLAWICDRAEAAEANVAELKSKKWEVQHTDTINDMVLLGLDRDAAQARGTELAEALKIAIREMRIAHNHVVPALQTSIYENLKTAIDEAHTALAATPAKAPEDASS